MVLFMFTTSFLSLSGVFGGLFFLCVKFYTNLS
nr:MAG TPA: hypothetical protein [Caudoviricetes sp.]